MPTTQEFLQAILPASGQYCATIIVNKQARNHFFSTIENLATGILLADKQLEGTDGAVYHGCASYDGRGRAASNVKLLSSFWLDIDVRASGRYNDLQTAIDHLRQFIEHYSLPDPILVCSGNGLHVYWPLEKELSRDEWQPIAQALKDACHTFGLEAGPERTADSASILRPIGTTHRKGSPRPVVCGPLMPRSVLERFNGLGDVGFISRNSVQLVPNNKPRSTSFLLQECQQNCYAPELIDFDTLCKECAQFRHFRDRRGIIPEPLWYSLLGDLGFCYDGDRVAHSWSCGHPKYSFAETERRLERVRNLSGPTTCSRIRGINPKGCEGCRYGDTTPLEAGRKIIQEDIYVQPTSEAPSMDGSLEGNAVEGYPEYVFKQGKLYHRTQTLTGAPVEIKLASFPVLVSSVHVGEINNDQYYYLFKHYKPHNGWHDVVVRPSQVHGPQMLSIMADLGVVVHDPSRFHMYIKDSVDSINRRRRAEMSYEQFGWKGDKFLYGDRLYGPEGPKTAAVSPELAFRSQWLKPVSGGSLEGWKQAVDNLMGAGSEGMSFTVLASFASVLMPFFDANEGGAVINLMTRHSGAGKTTALSGAMTVWSSDPRALELINIDTKVSKAVSIGALCNIPCIYDEFDNKDPVVVREFMEMFTSGRDKMRGTGTSTLQHTAASWRMILLTASNASIQDTIISTGRSEAPALRVLELPVESSGNLKPSELMALARQLTANAGWAGEEFISYLVQPGVKEWVTNKLRELVDEITEKGKFKKEHRFWVRALAAIGCASVIVEQLQLISFSPERIMSWALRHFGSAALTVKSEPKSMIEYLSSFLNANLGETLTMPGPSEGRKLFMHIGDKPRYKVNVRIELRGETCYIAQQPLRKWLEENAGGGYSALVKELQAESMLKDDNVLKTLSAGTEIEGGQVRCLAFDIGHPFFTGLLREVKEERRHQNNIRKLTQ